MARAKLKLADDTTRRPTRRLTFTKKALGHIKPPVEGELVIYDTKQSGLVFRVRAGGTRAFYLIKKFRGRVMRLKLGDFPDMTVEQARRATLAKIHDTHNGINPAEVRREARAAMAFGEMFTAIYLERHAKIHKRTWPEDEAMYNRHLKPWRSRQLDQISRVDVASLHARIGKTAPTAANRVLALLSKVYNVATDFGYKGDNPARRIKRFGEQRRERFLDADELPRFLKAVAADDNPVLRDYLMMLLFTGQRRSNVGSMAWSEVDTRRKVWTIPADKFKTGQSVEVPLVPAAMAILKVRKAEGGSEHVFPSRRSAGKVGHLTEPKTAFARVCESAGITNLRPHDLRRTLASWATMQGTPYPVVARMVGHKVQGVTGIYARFDINTLRRAFNKAVVAMLETIKKKPAKRSRG